MKFLAKKPHYEYLRKKWIAKHKASSEKFLTNNSASLRKMAIGGLGGLLLLTTPGMASGVPSSNIQNQSGIESTEDKNAILAAALKADIPKDNSNLTPEEEVKIQSILSEHLGINVKAELEGIRLNRTYGVIGGEQHLYRYPGDNLYKHADNAADSAMYIPAGIAPGLGAWGYFASSESAFTEKEKQEEKYYLAVQTFLVPGYAENVKKYSTFFKHRKMVVVNPKTGQAVVAVIGDAGPSPWTGKHLGGSPEVMQEVGLAGGPRKGPVLYFFIDDAQNEVPLGPIKVRKGGLN
ncbi:MAG: hypothetical protein PHQ59_02045 [Candidatus Daviesbacteria bacterium]|nr:hypothetical protein [Candidatus Daviesbacteria bacterium]